MYDELVKRLRKRANRWCSNCYYRCGDNVCGAPDDRKKDCYVASELQAADAIEDLEFACNRYEKDYKALCKYLPKWIPVTERLPEKKKAHYLCLLDDDSMAVVYWSKVPDWASKGEWTWHNPNWKEVTHWMPLPQPPKEE